MPEPIGDATMSALHAALSGLAQRQRVTADNIANINTPGFLAGKVDFESSLKQRDRRRRTPSTTAPDDRPLAGADQHQRQQRQPRRGDARRDRDRPALPAGRSTRSTASTACCASRSAGSPDDDLRHLRHRRLRPARSPQVDGRRLGQHLQHQHVTPHQRATRSRSGSSSPRPSTTAPAPAASGWPASSSAPARAASSTSPTTPWPTPTATCAYPDIDLGDQMAQLIMAQRGYQANLAVVERAPRRVPGCPPAREG